MPDTSVAHAPEDQRQKTYHRMLAASIVARMPPDDDDTSALAGWVRARIAGTADGVPDGLEGAAASVLTHTANYDEGDDGRAVARADVESFRRARRITEIDDAIAELKAQAESTEYTREQQITLNQLQREKAALRDQDRSAAT
jgi:hypothetical protein